MDGFNRKTGLRHTSFTIASKLSTTLDLPLYGCCLAVPSMLYALEPLGGCDAAARVFDGNARWTMHGKAHSHEPANDLSHGMGPSCTSCKAQGCCGPVWWSLLPTCAHVSCTVAHSPMICECRQQRSHTQTSVCRQRSIARNTDKILQVTAVMFWGCSLISAAAESPQWIPIPHRCVQTTARIQQQHQHKAQPSGMHSACETFAMAAPTFH
jgi:hypothetical protein